MASPDAGRSAEAVATPVVAAVRDSLSPSCAQPLFDLSSPGVQWIMPTYFGVCARHECPRHIPPTCSCAAAGGASHAVLHPRCEKHVAHMAREQWPDVDAVCEALYALPVGKGYTVRSARSCRADARGVVPGLMGVCASRGARSRTRAPRRAGVR